MYKQALALLLFFITVFSLWSCKSEPSFYHAEMVIPLPDEYSITENSDFDKTFTNGESAVAVLRISFAAAINEGIPDTFGADEFALLWLIKNDREAQMQVKDGVDFCEYYENVLGVEYYYLAAFYRSHHAYFVVLFTTNRAKEEAYRVKFIEYATEIYFKDGI